ncbi:SHOCT domain-containing protein [Bacillaceae bacterium S4-13-56]
MMGWMNDCAGGQGFFMWIGMILFWGLLFFAGFYFMKTYTGSSNSRVQNNAMDILKERFARGELSEEEYDRMKEKLK